ncbi:MAG: PAS domain S-box protein [Actinomycetota bacterium]|nr:PAS domain S-box protein [Actinomycetota bacterium]
MAQGAAGGARKEHLGAYLEAALDCVILADASGRVVEFNPAAERTFGYTREEALGRTLAELIVPPSLRELHRDAFARFVEARQKRLFGRRLAMTGMRADGSEFPVELALSCVESDPLLVCGALRDLTDVKRAESDLRTLADEQAALRRVATLVADEAAPDVIFASVAEEIARILMADRCAIGRFEADDSMTVVAYWSNEEPKLPVGTQIGLQGDDVTAAVRESRRPILIDDHEALSGPLIDYARTLGSLPRSTVAAPILVEGRVWGSIFASTMTVEIAEGGESRVVDFAELVTTTLINAETRDSLRRLVDEQAALRRVATLVAAGIEPDELFSAVCKEVAGLFRADWAGVGRYEPDGTGAVLVGQNQDLPGVPVGTRAGLDKAIVAGEIYRTRRPARNDVGAARAVGDAQRKFLALGFVSTVGAPVLVEGELWGYVAASSSHTRLPPNTERRIESFGELVATAIANAQSRTELAASEARARALANEQAALRRVATLVARGASPDELFSAVAHEVAGIVDIPVVAVNRYGADGTFTIVGIAGETNFSLGSRWPVEEEGIAGTILATGRPSRMDDYSTMPGQLGDALRKDLVVSTLAVPIVVEGSIWGFMIAAAKPGRPIPADTEERLARFTELVATAVSNATARSEVIASRARIVAAGDEARRRIERNLHDGTQQRLIGLGLDLQAARAGIPEELADTHSDLERIGDDLEAVLEDVRELSHGLHPALLSRAGLGPSVRELARKSPLPVELNVSVSERPAESIETAVYYVISEALANIVKHAHASEISLALRTSASGIRATIEDDGVGGAEASAGSGLVGLIDRVEALGGRFALDSPPGHGTRISIEMPLTAEPLGDVARVPGGRRSTSDDGPPPPPELSQPMEAALHAAIAASADALYIVDAQGRIAFLNRAAVRTLGYEDERQLLGRPSHDTIHYLRRDGTPFPAAECPLLRPRLNGETVRVEEDWFVRQDGSLVAVSYSSAPVALLNGRGAVVSFREAARQRPA